MGGGRGRVESLLAISVVFNNHSGENAALSKVMKFSLHAVGQNIALVSSKSVGLPHLPGLFDFVSF